MASRSGGGLADISGGPADSLHAQSSTGDDGGGDKNGRHGGASAIPGPSGPSDGQKRRRYDDDDNVEELGPVHFFKRHQGVPGSHGRGGRGTGRGGFRGFSGRGGAHTRHVTRGPGAMIAVNPANQLFNRTLVRSQNSPMCVNPGTLTVREGAKNVVATLPRGVP